MASWAGDKGKQARRDPPPPTSELDVDCLAGLIAVAGLPFSKRGNALYGPFHLATILVYMLRNGVCANAAIAAIWADMGLDPRAEIKIKSRRKTRFPTDQWLFRLFGAISPEEIEKRCDLMLDAQMKVVRGAGIMAEAVIDIIDIHNVPYYGKTRDDKHVVGTKAKDGTRKAESYATLLATSGDYPYCTAATRVTKGKSKAEIVAKLLDDRARRGIKALISMLDRGFFSVGVMQEFKDRGEHFLMGAVRTMAVKRALAEYSEGRRGAVSKCTIRSGKKSFTFTLIIVEKIEEDRDGKKKKVHVLYATNLPDEVVNAPGFDADELYSRRWDIETHYRKIEEVRPRTVSRNQGARTFFFFVAPILLNMWSSFNHREKNESEKQGAEKGIQGDSAPPPPAGGGNGGAGKEPKEGDKAGDEEKEDEEKEDEEKEDEEKEDEEGEDTTGKPTSDPSGADPGGGLSEESAEIVRLAIEVQNRPKRKYRHIRLIFMMKLVTKFREAILSWHYLRHKITRRIEGFVEYATGAA